MKGFVLKGKQDLCIAILLLVALLLCWPGPALFAGQPYRPEALSLVLPQNAFVWLAEAFGEPCPRCAEKFRAKAFRILDQSLTPGSVLVSDSSCRFIKSKECEQNELALTCQPAGEAHGLVPPLVTVMFHTPLKHLAGIENKYYSKKQWAQMWSNAPVGSVFSGAVKVVPFDYGDGECFSYFPKHHKLTIHCRIIGLSLEQPKPASVQGAK